MLLALRAWLTTSEVCVVEAPEEAAGIGGGMGDEMGGMGGCTSGKVYIHHKYKLPCNLSYPVSQYPQADIIMERTAFFEVFCGRLTVFEPS